MPQRPATTLFLHAGPGLNAHVERQVLGDRYPHIHFWDQPSLPQRAGAFRFLVDAAAAEVERLAAASGGRVDLLAHSFGGHLAAALLERLPERVGDCRLVSVIHDVPTGYLNLLRLMAADAATERGLRDDITAFLAAHPATRGDPARVWEYFGLIVREAAVLRRYWLEPAHYRRYTELAATGPAWDAETFRNVLEDFLADYGQAPQPVLDKPVRIELGGRDPLLNLDPEIALWRARFPRADITVRPGSGHFIHLEPYL